ncbi:MAG TPA: class B sortase [Ruminococcaceae bacterium]|nr:class B sortase [Oscillospiraceae bacterium]
MRSKKAAILVSLIIIFALIFTGVLGFLIYKMVSIQNAQDDYKAIAASYANGDNPEGYTGNLANNSGTTSPEQVEHTLPFKIKDVNVLVKFDELKKQNSDIYAWIYIPDTNINYPVLQSGEDDNFYLDHDVYKNYSFPGAIYSQSNNKKDWSDRVTVLYGHNMLSGAMFADLHKFSDSSFFDSHPYIYVFAENRRLIYKIISASSYDNRHILNSFDFKNNKVFKDWLDNAQHPHSMYSKVRDGIELNLNSKILVLSTCLNSGSGRYLVQGVLVQDEHTK